MTEVQLCDLFQPFVQVHRADGGVPGGTGLGLAISKRLVDMLEGEICVESSPGKGSTFRVAIDTGPAGRLQMCEQIGEAIAASSASAKSRVGFAQQLDCRVLLVEDGSDNQRLIGHLLRKAGAHVTVVDNGHMAVDFVRRQQEAASPFDLILMDMQMPILDGYEATRQLRKSGYQNPIIALTAHAMKDDRQKCLDAGCDDYLTKPIDRESLLAAVAQQAAKARVSSRPEADALITA
jgi:CheY-like chemotaxis protein